jgi:hypothetical protein
MATIASLVIQISADSTKLKQGLANANDRVKSFAATAKGHIQKFATTAANLLKNISKWVAAGLTGAFAGLTAIISANSKAAKNLLQVSNALGVSVRQLTEWEAAAKTVGIEGEKMSDILKDVADKLGDYVATGGGEAAEIFKRLNLNVKDFIGLNSGDALLQIGQAMSNLTNKEQVFLMEALANDASRLLPLFKEGATGYKEAVNEAIRSGNILSQQQADQAASFSRSVAALNNRVSGFGKQLTVQLARPFAQMVDWINEAIDRMGGIDVVAKNVSVEIINMVSYVVEAGAEMSQVFLKLKLFVNEFIGAIQYSIGELLKGIANIRETMANAFSDVPIPFVSAIGKVSAIGNDAIKDVARSFTNAANQTAGDIQTLQNQINTAETTADKFREKAEQLKGLVGSDSSEKSPVNNAIKAYDESANAVNDLANAAANAANAMAPAAKSYSPISQASGSAEDDELFGFGGIAKRMAANVINPDLSKTGGLSGFKNFLSPGMYQDELPSSKKLGSVQDYINQSPSGKKLQDLRNKNNPISGQPTTRITLDMVTNSGKVSGELLGNQKFIDELSKLQNKNTNKAARMATI